MVDDEVPERDLGEFLLLLDADSQCITSKFPDSTVTTKAKQ